MLVSITAAYAYFFIDSVRDDIWEISLNLINFVTHNKL